MEYLVIVGPVIEWRSTMHGPDIIFFSRCKRLQNLGNLVHYYSVRVLHAPCIVDVAPRPHCLPLFPQSQEY